MQNNPLENYPDLLTVADLCVIFNVSKATIYKEIKAGKFGKPLSVGRVHKIPRNYIIQKFFSCYT